MNMVPHRQLPPSAQGGRVARALWQFLSRYQRSKAQVRQRVTDGEQAEPIELPAGAVALLMDISEAMAAGQAVTIIPEIAELTTVQAADVLKGSHHIYCIACCCFQAVQTVLLRRWDRQPCQVGFLSRPQLRQGDARVRERCRFGCRTRLDEFLRKPDILGDLRAARDANSEGQPPDTVQQEGDPVI